MGLAMEHEGYLGLVELDVDDNVLHGRVVNIRDVVTFQGRSVEELRQAFAESIEDYREMCEEEGVEPQKPFSGKFVVRLDPELHRQLVIAAATANRSLNAFIQDTLRETVQRMDVPQHA